METATQGYITARVQYCSMHQRAWVASLSQWLAFPEPPMDGNYVTEAACDFCTAVVRRTFRAQFPALYFTSPEIESSPVVPHEMA
jgi:hypothetical protein